MGWILFEALLALAVMVAAAWWTFRGRREPAVTEPGAGPAPPAPDRPADPG